MLVAAGRDVNASGKILHIGPLVDKGKLHMDRGVEVI